MEVSKERKRRAMARKMIDCIAYGKYKPPKKAVEEFRRPAYGFGKKGEEDEEKPGV